MTKALGARDRPSYSSKGHLTIVAVHLIEGGEATRGARVGISTNAAHLHMLVAGTMTGEEVEAGTLTEMESGIAIATGHGAMTDSNGMAAEALVRRTVGRKGRLREAICAHRETTDVSVMTGTGTSQAGRSAISSVERVMGATAEAAGIAMVRAPDRMASAQVDGKSVATLAGAKHPVNPVPGASMDRPSPRRSERSQRA